MGKDEEEESFRVVLDGRTILSLRGGLALEMDVDRVDAPWLKLEWHDYSDNDERLLARVLMSAWDVVDWAMFVPMRAAEMTFEAARRGGFPRRRQRQPRAPMLPLPPHDHSPTVEDEPPMMIIEIPGREPIHVVDNSVISVEPEDATFRLQNQLPSGGRLEVVIPAQELMDWGIYVMSNAVQTAFEAGRAVVALKLELALRFGEKPK
jgi:hypothetical protein